MRIHHLNCGSHCPVGGFMFDGTSNGPLAHICTHCLLVETPDCLVLVDTGYGLKDVRRNTGRRLPFIWPLILNTRLREQDTAIHQIKAMGFSARDVRHIVLTHLDFDHAGGLADFPDATVHVMSGERQAAENARGFIARQRYRPAMWKDVKQWRMYETGGETWFGLQSVRDLDGLPPEILMAPLPGHTVGHAGVAIRSADRWLLNAGDSFMHVGQLDPTRPNCPAGIELYQAIMSTNRNARLDNLERLRELKRDHGSDVSIFASHDGVQLAAMRSAAP
ncbi:glyoxylase-like metal-dependent hydrolase (beta-lactamase superfamily II) [Rhizobium sp. SG_E_25_P2]|uniref:MBL fold metallo-hydrolase n=1 Tax=Rhizobium sp. SG_E_25_P2 TaxID=2879942 RepID=UPI00247421E8|nr:MBL fold metallo-hydrolase [Rhizobium sp. SG_E_25_P2]MDH6264839.1 glyoxylase-like metal-dependent hydrolase (beta-lactamase superfamily II) [Rhizobium sp. SG_E_25_P2]